MITRRQFVRDAALAGAAAMLGPVRDALGAEPPPEVRRIRFLAGGLCTSPTRVAEALLRAEGFDEIRHSAETRTAEDARAQVEQFVAGEFDFSFGFVTQHLRQVDASRPLVMLAGGHAGCIEVVGGRGVRTLRDLRGRRVAAATRNGGPASFLSLMLAYIGIDPERDVGWRMEPRLDAAVRLLEAGEIHAYASSPPTSLHLRERKVGQVIVNSTTDRPWSEHFCCMIAAHREFVHRHPVATKRALRAILKAEDLCASDPERAAGLVTSRNAAAQRGVVAQMMKELPYQSWRMLNPENTVRFFSIRMREIGLLRSDPAKIIAQGTDWRILEQLKKELKA